MRKPLRKPLAAKPASRPSARPLASKKPKPGEGKKPAAGFDKGEAGFRKASVKRERQEADYQRRKDTPYVFKLKPGESAEVIILDKGAPTFLSLHKVKQPGPQGRWVDEVCIADTGQKCPLCEMQGKEGSYTMVTTILDRRPYKTRDGKTIKVSKKLMLVKGRNLPKFERQYEGKAKKNFRGFKLLCNRGGEKESSMGEDIEFMARVSEEFLSKFGDNAKPADYAKIFAMPSAAELRKRYGITKGKVTGGEEFSEDDDETEDGYSSEDVGWGEDEDE